MIKHILRFERRDITVSHHPDGADVVLHEGICRAAPGAPALPGRMLYIALPPGKIVSRVSARIVAQETLLDGPVLIRPQPTPGISSLAMDAPAAPQRIRIAPDEALYLAAQEAPLCELRGTNVMGSVPVVAVFVRPVRMGDCGSLELVTAMELLLSTTADKKHRTRRSLPQSPRAIRFQDLVARLVLNPEAVPAAGGGPSGTSGTGSSAGGMPPGAGSGGTLPGLAAVPAGAGPAQVDYLIITDDHEWDTANVTQGAHLGDIVAAFAPLVAHKKKRGLRAHIATVTDIVNGVYGDHLTGANDLPEVLRRFLQAYTYSRGVEWVLLGGDVNIVPPRYVCGSVAHGIFDAATGVAGDKVPQAGEYAWKGTYLALRLSDKAPTDAGQIGQPDHILTMLSSGQRVPRVDTPTGDALCWFYTDATWTTPSAATTSYVRVNGPAATINDQPQWYTPDNLLPSDLYYASLFGPNDLKPGKHDWDLLDQGLYGQWSWDVNLGGIDFTPDISVGRAPVGSPAEADTFVSKVIAYETADTRPLEYDRFRKILYVAEHWDHAAAAVTRNATDAMPPGAWSYSYSYDPANQRSLVRAEGLADGSFPQLLAYLPGNVRRVIPYDHDGAARGWHYAVSDTDLSPSTITIPIPFFKDLLLPARTAFVVVRSPDPAELTPESYFFDPNDLDGSIADLDKIRAYMQGAHPRVNDIRRLYTDEEDLDAAATATAPLAHYTPAAVAAALQQGPHLVALSGHGNWPGCCGVNEAVSVGLTNGDRTSIVFADSCLTARMDHNDCLGEAMVVRAQAAAVAYIGYTRWGWIGTGGEYQADFFKQIRAQRHLGLMVDATRRFWTNGRYGRWHAISTTLFGCPEMSVIRDDLDAHPTFVGNARSREMHQRFCPWVRWMSLRNIRSLPSVASGLAAGYDGCGFCLRAHHTR